MFRVLSLALAILLSGITMPSMPMAVPKPGNSSLPPITSLSFTQIYDDEEPDTIISSVYGPFAIGSDDTDISFTYTLHTSIPRLIERMRLISPNTGSVLSSTSLGAFSYSYAVTKSVTFTLPLRAYWSTNGLTLKFEILNASNYQVIKEYSATFYPPQSSYVSAATLRNEKYQSRALGFVGDGRALKAIYEEFDFTYLGNYLVADYYYRLPLEEIYFYYESEFDFSYYNAFLSFIDDRNLFPYLTRDEDDTIEIPLALFKNADKVSVRLKNKLYVNKKTLQVSSVYRTNYVQTSVLYLPINGRKAFNGKRLYLTLNKLGKCQINTSFSFVYDATTSLIGLCTDGEHCVTGGIR